MRQLPAFSVGALTLVLVACGSPMEPEATAPTLAPTAIPTGAPTGIGSGTGSAPVVALAEPTGTATTVPTAQPDGPLAPPIDNEVWLNSPRLAAEDLRGHPVLVEFWTFG